MNRNFFSRFAFSLGFNLFYQTNITLFGAGALLRLWKETGDEYFLQQSYVNLASAFNQMWLWECNYGYAEHYKTFFALFPLKDAPYTAVYEELEGFAAFHDYLNLRENPAGPNAELWQHAHGCRVWLRVVLDTRTHAVLEVALAREAAR